MDTAMLIEIFGYIGSALVVVSMLMSSVVKLRVINTFGSIISGTYAFIVGAFPLLLMNICLIVINVYNLFKLLKTEQQYDMVEGTAEDKYLAYFLERYKDDIKSFFPAFTMNDKVDYASYVCCEGVIAGVLLGTKKEDGTIDVALDYSTPVHRDCSVGKYLYSKLPSKGIKTLVFSQNASETHTSYLVKMGFVKENNSYVKKL